MQLFDNRNDIRCPTTAGTWGALNGPHPCDLERSADIGQYCLPVLACGQSYPDQLLESDAFSAARSLRYTDRYFISLNQGQTLTLLLSSSAFDTFLYLFAPNGSQVAQDNNGTGGTNSKIVHTPSMSGSYRIEVTSNLASATGAYNLVTSCNTGGEPLPGCDDPVLIYNCEYVWGGHWLHCGCISPIVVDISGNGFNLTSAIGGVDFDIDGDGIVERLSWTAAGSDDVWLAIDLNGNGSFDNGTELFGTYSPQPSSDEPNGFLALAEYDEVANGGNADGSITEMDSVFASLRFWQDRNHNGVSESSEIFPCRDLGVVRFDLEYRVSSRQDQHGNKFRYRAKVYDAQGHRVGRWAWDVLLQVP